VGPGSGGGSGGGTGGGNGTGTGPGNGNGAGGGSRTTLPTTDFMPLPPGRPKNIAHGDYVLRVAVNERGDVTDVQLLSSTGNRGFDEQVKRSVRDWKFTPARDLASNRAVAASVDITISL
jgi:protein TonB